MRTVIETNNLLKKSDLTSLFNPKSSFSNKVIL